MHYNRTNIPKDMPAIVIVARKKVSDGLPSIAIIF